MKLLDCSKGLITQPEMFLLLYANVNKWAHSLCIPMDNEVITHMACHKTIPAGVLLEMPIKSPHETEQLTKLKGRK